MSKYDIRWLACPITILPELHPDGFDATRHIDYSVQIGLRADGLVIWKALSPSEQRSMALGYKPAPEVISSSIVGISKAVGKDFFNQHKINKT